MPPTAAKRGVKADRAWKYKDAKKATVNAHKKIFPKSACSKKCLEAQLDAYHKKIGCDEDTDLRTGTQSLKDWQKQSDRAILKQMGKQITTA